MGAVRDVTDATFETEVLKSTKPVVVDFWASWCGPCKQIAPILNEIASEHDGIQILKLNADDNPQSVGAYGVTSLPTLAVFANGEIVKTIIGARPKPQVIKELQPWLS